MKKILIKLAISLLLMFAVGVIMFFYMQGSRDFGLINSNGGTHLLLIIVMILISAIVLMYLPANIKSYPTGKKILIGSFLFIIAMILFFAAFIGSAVLFG